MNPERTAYYSNTRNDLWPYLPKTCTRMLDVGCGAGAFAESCKQHFSCETWGIEYVHEMADVARGRLDHVFAGDAMVEIPKLPEAAFDFVTFTDVLEHLVDPAEALRLTRRVLAPGGKVLASIPNIRYWHDFLYLVMDKDFPAKESGIFDRTHLRFFTKKSVPRIFEEAGYEVESIEGINPTPSKQLKLFNLLTFNSLSDCKHLQYAVTARVRA